jgi:hypothetical protein
LFELVQKGFCDGDDDNEEMEDCSVEECKTAASADTELLTKQATKQRKSAVADATTALLPGKAIMCGLVQSITWAPPVVLSPFVLFTRMNGKPATLPLEPSVIQLPEEPAQKKCKHE